MQISGKVRTSLTTAILAGFLGVAASANGQTSTDNFPTPTLSSKSDLVTLLDSERLHLGEGIIQADRLNRDALSAAQANQNRELTAQLLNDAALIGVMQHDGTAMDKAQEAISARRRLFGEESEKVADSLNTMALINASNKNFEAAEQNAKAALAIESLDTEKNAVRIADTYSILANTMLIQGQNKVAADLADKAMDIHVKALGPSNPVVAHDLYTLANVALTQADTNKARDLFNRSLSIADTTEKPSDFLALSVLSAIAGDMPKSKELFEKCWSLLNTNIGADQPVTLGTRALYVKALWDHQRWMEALQNRNDLPAQTNSTATQTVENLVFERAIQTPQIQTYNWQNVALCVMFGLVPLTLIGIMVVFKNLFKVPTSNGFNEFVEQNRTRKPSSTTMDAPKPEAAKTNAMVASTSPSGRLALKNLRDRDLTATRK